MPDFAQVDLSGARFDDVDLSYARFREVDLTEATIRGATVVDVDISGDVQNVLVNGVDVVPLVEAGSTAAIPIASRCVRQMPTGSASAGPAAR